MNEVKHRQIEYKCKEAMRAKYTSHGTPVPQFDGEYEHGVLELAENIYRYILRHDTTKARHWCYTMNLDPDKYIE